MKQRRWIARGERGESSKSTRNQQNTQGIASSVGVASRMCSEGLNLAVDVLKGMFWVVLVGLVVWIRGRATAAGARTDAMHAATTAVATL